MKKISALMLSAVLLILFTACSADKAEANESMLSGRIESTQSVQTESMEKNQTESMQNDRTESAQSGRGESMQNDRSESTQSGQTESGEANTMAEKIKETELKMMIGDQAVTVEWEDNESAKALKQLAENGPLTIQMSMYGGFEQVGAIGSSLPRNDVQTTTQACDIVLYSGDQIVVFYGSNSWAYTRLGRITDKTAEEMAKLLGNGDVVITLSAE